MRNGLNISGVSEMVHEIRENPREAMADYAVSGPAEPDATGALHSKALTLRNGTVRVARDFRLRQQAHTAARTTPYAPTPVESALAAMAACVLITTVNGITARGVTIGSMRVTARGDLPLEASGRPAAAPLENLGWHCEVDCAAPPDAVRSIARTVCGFSPNHRVFLDESPIEAVVPADGGAAVRWEPADGDVAGTCPVEAEVVWEYGSEAVYRTTLTTGGIRREAGPLVVDQAKQMLGVDKGPNAQEILLSALCGELATLIPEEAAARGVRLTGPRLRAEGRLDMRGMLNVEREVPSAFHNLRVALTTETGQDGAEAVLGAAMSRAVLPATLGRARTIAVSLAHRGHPEVAYENTTREAEEIRDEVTRRQREAAAAEASVAS